MSGMQNPAFQYPKCSGRPQGPPHSSSALERLRCKLSVSCFPKCNEQPQEPATVLQIASRTLVPMLFQAPGQAGSSYPAPSAYAKSFPACIHHQRFCRCQRWLSASWRKPQTHELLPLHGFYMSVSSHNSARTALNKELTYRGPIILLAQLCVDVFIFTLHILRHHIAPGSYRALQLDC